MIEFQSNVSDNCTTILFVADPQILGEKYETEIFNSFAIADSDRHLHRTFRRAMAFAKPDVVCFMGDLMDEGSIANEEEYLRYAKRFHETFSIPSNVIAFSVPGDNDIGGEGHDYVTKKKHERFQKTFNEMNDLILRQKFRLINTNMLTRDFPDLIDIDKQINIIVSHMSLLSYPGLSMKTVSQKSKEKLDKVQ